MASSSKQQDSHLDKTGDVVLGEVQEYIGDIFKAPEGSVLIRKIHSPFFQLSREVISIRCL